MYRLCLMSEAFARDDLSRWRVGGYGGAPMPEATIAALAERLPRLTLLNAYGATETTSPATLMPHGPAARPRRLGRRAAALRRHPRDGRRRPRAAARRDRRALDRRADGRARLLGQCRGDGGIVHRRLLALRRPRLDRRRGLRAHLRPQEGHAQSRRLQGLFGRGRERADGLARRGRGGGDRRALPGARRARARGRPRARRRRRTTRRCAPTAPRCSPTTRCPRRSPGAASRCRATPTARS